MGRTISIHLAEASECRLEGWKEALRFIDDNDDDEADEKGLFGESDPNEEEEVIDSSEGKLEADAEVNELAESDEVIDPDVDDETGV